MTGPSAGRAGFIGDPPARADVVVVGAGIAGVSAAYHLAARGVDVAVLERGRVGAGATSAAVGVLSPPVRQPFHETVHFQGEETARSMWAFALRSVKALGRLLEERGEADEAGLDLSGGYILAEPHSRRPVEESHRALEAAGFPVSWLTGPEACALTNGGGFVGGYRIEGGGALEAGPTTCCLARAASEAGARVVEEVTVSEVARCDGAMVCRTPVGEVRCEMVVYATHVDSRRFSGFLGDEVVPIRGQTLRVDTGVPTFAGSFSTHWKLNTWRSDHRGRLMLGGWRHDAWDRSYWKMRPEVDDRLQASLQAWFEGTFPHTAPLSVTDRGSGIFGWTADYLPLVGPLPGGTRELVIAGFSGGGLPFAFESGRVIASVVTGDGDVPGSALLNPRRFT